ncbi:Hypothetical predicted protein [Pelobates cultripes]|uniref:Uncharacterized protein n=1 Tax=Pelobates cultripes TaxID=61616 RepID=A0AAD1R556_PELCU|nr:Hypothetical predicted protein [Pelobates cultripes]
MSVKSESVITSITDTWAFVIAFAMEALIKACISAEAVKSAEKSDPSPDIPGEASKFSFLSVTGKTWTMMPEPTGFHPVQEHVIHPYIQQTTTQRQVDRTGKLHRVTGQHVARAPQDSFVSSNLQEVMLPGFTPFTVSPYGLEAAFPASHISTARGTTNSYLPQNPQGVVAPGPSQPYVAPYHMLSYPISHATGKQRLPIEMRALYQPNNYIENQEKSKVQLLHMATGHYQNPMVTKIYPQTRQCTYKTSAPQHYQQSPFLIMELSVPSVSKQLDVKTTNNCKHIDPLLPSDSLVYDNEDFTNLEAVVNATKQRHSQIKKSTTDAHQMSSHSSFNMDSLPEEMKLFRYEDESVKEQVSSMDFFYYVSTYGVIPSEEDAPKPKEHIKRYQSVGLNPRVSADAKHKNLSQAWPLYLKRFKRL